MPSPASAVSPAVAPLRTTLTVPWRSPTTIVPSPATASAAGCAIAATTAACSVAPSLVTTSRTDDGAETTGDEAADAVDAPEVIAPPPPTVITSGADFGLSSTTSPAMYDAS